MSVANPSPSTSTAPAAGRPNLSTTSVGLVLAIVAVAGDYHLGQMADRRRTFRHNGEDAHVAVEGTRKASTMPNSPARS